jgi:hypothetical protein
VSYSAPLPPVHGHSAEVSSTYYGVLPGFDRASMTTVGAWPSANLAIYIPIGLPRRVIVRTLYFASGTTGTGNVAMGLYLPSGVAVVGPATAAKGTSAIVQVIDVTDAAVGPGLYYLGLSCSNATDTFYRSASSAPLPAAGGILVETSAYPLPSTATFALDQGLSYVPYVGLFVEATAA